MRHYFEHYFFTQLIIGDCLLTDTDEMRSPLRFETEREKEICQQLKQANDEAARLQDELRQATDREAQLQQQLYKMNPEMKYHDSKGKVNGLPVYQ